MWKTWVGVHISYSNWIEKFPFSVYLHNECFTDPICWNFNENRLSWWVVEAGGEKKEGWAVKGEVYDYLIHNMQFNVKSHMIS